MLNRRHVLSSLLISNLLPKVTLAKHNKINKKDKLVFGLSLEPPSLDPSKHSSSVTGEIVLYNIFETLTKINEDGSIAPLLAEKWQIKNNIYTFYLRQNIKFHNGENFNSKTVKFSLDKAKSEISTNSNKIFYLNLKTKIINDYIIQIKINDYYPDLLFMLGQSTSIMVEPKSSDNNYIFPIGTGPYKFRIWQKGYSINLIANNQWQDFNKLIIKEAEFRFINDNLSQIIALLSGDIDILTQALPRTINQFKDDKKNNKFQLIAGNSWAKIILAFNHNNKILKLKKVRQAINLSINKNDYIKVALDNYGVEIGSYYTPDNFYYVDNTKINSYNLEKARQLINECNFQKPLNLVLPPRYYARYGAELIAYQLSKIGIKIKIKNLEWASWLNEVFSKKKYDLTIISHNETFDLDNFTKEDYYWNYYSEKFNNIYEKLKKSSKEKDRKNLLIQIQNFLSEEAVHGFLAQPQNIIIAPKNLIGLRKNMPIFVNELSQLKWI